MDRCISDYYKEDSYLDGVIPMDFRCYLSIKTFDISVSKPLKRMGWGHRQPCEVGVGQGAGGEAQMSIVMPAR